MGHKKKKERRTPKHRFNPKSEKTPRLGGNPDSFAMEQPCWRFGRFDTDGGWGRCGIELDHLFEQILTKMSNYESMTWGDIRKDRKRNHFISVTRLASAAQQRLNELNVTEERLFRFRLSGKERVWGIVDGAVFYVLWWDPEHEICPSTMKHT